MASASAIAKTMVKILLFAVLMGNAENLKPDLMQSGEQLCSRIECLYTGDYLNEKKIDVCADVKSRQLRLDLLYARHTENRAKIEDLLISRFELIRLPTDPKSDISSEWVDNRAKWVGRFRLFNTRYKDDEKNFWRLCRYLSSVAYIDYPQFYARHFKVRQSQEKREEIERQVRVRELNIAIHGYRQALMNHCASYLGLVGVDMGDEEFAALSNRVIAVTKIPEKERPDLFADIGFRRRIKKSKK